MSRVVHVLLIEDNPFDVLLTREAMRQFPTAADVVIAYDGVQALEEMRNSAFDLIILDLNLPKLNGHVIIERARLDSGPPIVVFSASDNPLDKRKALALGAEDYIVKPRNYADFMKAVQEILEHWTEEGSATTAI